MKGYKVFNKDWTCRGFQYKVGEEFSQSEEPDVCYSGFHFCETLIGCFNYYAFDPENKIAEIEAVGEISSGVDKYCTDRIRIVREITWQEALSMVNTGKECTGMGNTGDYNSGSWNAGKNNSGSMNTGSNNKGEYNTGDSNSGTKNSGDRNTGYGNVGNGNSGHENTGSYNEGERNTDRYNIGGNNSGTENAGSYNTGSKNIGNRNSGSYNSGYGNTGNFNKGNFNSGDWNLASWASGCFNTEERKLIFFDKESDMTMDEWRSSRACRLLLWSIDSPVSFVLYNCMTDEEKMENPEALTTGGYLKRVNMQSSIDTWWAGLEEPDIRAILDIPNFDAEKFKLITGIDVNKK